MAGPSAIFSALYKDSMYLSYLWFYGWYGEYRWYDRIQNDTYYDMCIHVCFRKCIPSIQSKVYDICTLVDLAHRLQHLTFCRLQSARMARSLLFHTNSSIVKSGLCGNYKNDDRCALSTPDTAGTLGTQSLVEACWRLVASSDLSHSMAWITRWPFGHHMDPQGPKYPMGVYLDELRVMEIFEGSPAEKAASLSRPCVQREIHIEISKVWVLIHQGEKMCHRVHHSCIMFYEFCGFGEIFLSLVGDGTELLTVAKKRCQAGILIGDILQKVNGVEITTQEDCWNHGEKIPPREFTQTHTDKFIYNIIYIHITWN